MKSKSKIYVAGHGGMVGSAIVRILEAQNKYQIVTKPRIELDLLNQAEVKFFFEREKPDQVFIAAAKVGGIYANSSYPSNFIYENLMIAANLIDAAFCSGVQKLLYLGSSCIYPKYAQQPIKEDALLSGYLEPTNEPYAIAKIAGIKLCESYSRQYGASHGVDYRSIMPANLYGPGDSYHLENSHVVPALIRRFHEAKIAGDAQVVVWGTGQPRREFLYVDDLAEASVRVMNLDAETYKRSTAPFCSHINVGFGSDVSIGELAEAVRCVVGYKGKIVFDSKMPDGSPRKLLDSSVIKSLGWSPKVKLGRGLALAYKDFLQNPLVRK